MDTEVGGDSAAITDDDPSLFARFLEAVVGAFSMVLGALSC